MPEPEKGVVEQTIVEPESASLTPELGRPNQFPLIIQNVISRVSSHSITIKAISMLASTSFLGTIAGIIGSLVQAHFISPDTLGFVRKYSVVSGYAVFLSFGLFIIFQREYPLLVGKGEQEKARRVAAIVQSWILLVCSVVGGVLFVVMFSELLRGHFREAAAWLVQIVVIWATLYGGYLSSTFLSSFDFKGYAKGQVYSYVSGLASIPLFFIWPFPALILRSIFSVTASTLYFHIRRPVKVGWYLPWRDFLDLVKRGMRLYAGDYLRYIFWLTVEIWLLQLFAGDAGVGLYVFSSMVVTFTSLFSVSVNQVYIPRLAQTYGKTGSIRSILKIAVKPTLMNLGVSILIIGAVWLCAPLVGQIFPKYIQAVPLIRILVFQSLLVSLSLPVYMLTLLDGYGLQIVAAVAGLGVFIGTAFILDRYNFQAGAVAGGTLVGQGVFALIILLWIFFKARREALATVAE